MYEMMTAPQKDAKAVGNVQAVTPQMRRFRAVVTRHIRQTAVVEFDAMEGQDQYAIGEQVVGMIPETAWMTEDPSSGYVSNLTMIDTDALPSA